MIELGPKYVGQIEVVPHYGLSIDPYSEGETTYEIYEAVEVDGKLIWITKECYGSKEIL